MKPAHVCIAALFATATVMGRGKTCRADYGPSAVVFEMIAEQQEQNVIVSMGTVYSSGGGRLLRTDDSTGEEVEIIPNNPGLPIVDEEPSEYCAPYFGIGGLMTDQGMYCDPNPEACVDCDGDNVGECVEECETAKYFEATDVCVPPGVYTYTTAYASQIMEEVVNDSVQIEVFDNDYAACAGEEEPLDDDTEETDGTDSETVIVEDDTEYQNDTDSDVDTADSEEHSDSNSDSDSDTDSDSDSDTTNTPYDEDVDSDTSAVTADPATDTSTETLADSPSAEEVDNGSTVDGTTADENASAEAHGCAIVSVGIFQNAQGILSILSALL